MSRQADRIRSLRQTFAAPGSRFDRIIAVLRIALPVLIGVLAAFLALAPFSSKSEISFVLNREEVQIAEERLRVEEARYRGEDASGRPFSLRAKEAVQQSSKVPILKMTDLSARILLRDGPAQITAPDGKYNMDEETVRVDGAVQVTAAGGYRLSTRNVNVDLEKRTLRSQAPVDGRANIGTFRADRLEVDLPARTMTLDGNASLRIVQNGLRGG